MSIRASLSAENIKLDNETIERLDNFALILNEYNMVHNITGAKTINRIEENIIDAIYPINFITFPNSVLDIGTGAGFPGLVLAIVAPSSHFTLCEPLGKRVAFLRLAVMQLGLKNVTIKAKRVEMLNDSKYGMITSRAVTNTKLLIDLTPKIRDKHTQYLLYKGSRVFDELSDVQYHKLSYDIIEHNFRNYLHIKSINVV